MLSMHIYTSSSALYQFCTKMYSWTGNIYFFGLSTISFSTDRCNVSHSRKYISVVYYYIDVRVYARVLCMYNIIQPYTITSILNGQPNSHIFLLSFISLSSTCFRLRLKSIHSCNAILCEHPHAPHNLWTSDVLIFIWMMCILTRHINSFGTCVCCIQSATWVSYQISWSGWWCTREYYQLWWWRWRWRRYDCIRYHPVADTDWRPNARAVELQDAYYV